MAFEQFKGKKFSEVKAQATTDKKEIYKKIPAKLRKGKEAKENGGFFDYKLLISKSNPNEGGDPNAVHLEQDPNTGETELFVTASILREMFLTYFQTTAGFPTSSFLQISQSFFSQIGEGLINMPAGELAGILGNPFAEGSIGSENEVIPPCTASFKFLLHPGVNDDNLVISNTSTNALYSTWLFDGLHKRLFKRQSTASNALTAAGLTPRSFSPNGFLYIQEDFEPVWSVAVNTTTGSVDEDIVGEDTGNGTHGHLFALTSSYSSSEDYGIISGSVLQVSGNINSPSAFLQGGRNYAGGSDESSGYFYQGDVKGFVSGEGEFGPGELNENSSRFQIKKFIYYPKNTLTVRSGSFLFIPEFSPSGNANGAVSALTQAATSTTLYYISGASHTSGAFTGSFCGNASKAVSGSHLWLDANLRTPASAGFYAIPGTNQVLAGFIGGVTRSFVIDPTDGGTSRDTVPRFSSKSIH